MSNGTQATYVVGTGVECQATFTNSSGALASPTEVTFRVQNAADTIATYTTPDSAITNPSTGVFVLAFTPDAVGVWNIEVSGAGGLTVVGGASINVDESVIESI